MKYKQCTINIAPKPYKEIVKLQKQTNSKDVAEVIQKAISLLKCLTKLENKGYKIRAKRLLSEKEITLK